MTLTGFLNILFPNHACRLHKALYQSQASPKGMVHSFESVSKENWLYFTPRLTAHFLS